MFYTEKEPVVDLPIVLSRDLISAYSNLREPTIFENILELTNFCI
jgi:hypothetical protein